MNDYADIRKKMLEMMELQERGMVKDQKEWRERYQSAQKQWNFEYGSIPDHLKQYWKRDDAVSLRNAYGEPMYSEECVLCGRHEDGWFTCDLCHQLWIEKRIHYLRERVIQEVVPATLLSSKRREEFFFHACPSMPKMLTHLLITVVI